MMLFTCTRGCGRFLLHQRGECPKCYRPSLTSAGLQPADYCTEAMNGLHSGHSLSGPHRLERPAAPETADGTTALACDACGQREAETTLGNGCRYCSECLAEREWTGFSLRQVVIAIAMLEAAILAVSLVAAGLMWMGR